MCRQTKVLYASQYPMEEVRGWVEDDPDCESFVNCSDFLIEPLIFGVCC